MYVVTDRRLATFDVTWDTLDESGETVTHGFRMKCELVPLDQFDTFLAAFSGGGDGETPADFVRRVASDWFDIAGPGKKPFPFNPRNLNIILQSPGFITGWCLSYIRAWHGQGKVREKNSLGSRGDGQAAAPRTPRRRARPTS